MDIKTQILEAQKLIVDNLAQCEESIAELYAAYGNSFPEMMDFWQTLSNDETAHAHLLKTLHKQLEQGYIFNNIGRFDKPAIDAFITKSKSELAVLKEKPVSVSHAITLALSMEASLVEGHFYEIVTSDAPEYQIIADYLTKATNFQIELIRKQFLKQKSRNAPNVFSPPL